MDDQVAGVRRNGPEPDGPVPVARSHDGWVQDMVAGRSAGPPAAAHLGLTVLEADPDRGRFRASFVARPEFANMMGGVQGGFLAAMLDVTMSAALLVTLSAGHVAPTLQMSLQYLAPAPIATLTGHGRLVRAGRTVAFLAGELVGPDGTVLTAATATARIVRRP